MLLLTIIAVMTGTRVAALPDNVWDKSEWIAAADAPVSNVMWRAADGTSRFLRIVENRKAVRRARWMTTALGVYELEVNSVAVGREFLKPGFTHTVKARHSYTYDVTSMIVRSAGARNVFSADVSSGWWRDHIGGRKKEKSAFRSVLEIVYDDGETEFIGTEAGKWRAMTGGPVTHAGIFDGEEYDARRLWPTPEDMPFRCETYGGFKGEIRPSGDADVYHREDLATVPRAAYIWSGTEGADEAKGIYGKVRVLRRFADGGKIVLRPGETLVADFAQNCAAVPRFRFSAAAGTRLTCLVGEALNDSAGEKSRGNDGPAGSVYRANLRIADKGMRIVYTFAGDGSAPVTYSPRFTFFGYRYLSITADGEVTFEKIESVPVTSITADMETGSLLTGHETLNRFISNVRWGMLSNYLSIPADCPQRNERLGWSADTQVFTAAALYGADVGGFLRKWMRDMDDSRCPRGGYSALAPTLWPKTFRFGWSDGGVIVPYTVWLMTGDRRIVEENYVSMRKFVDVIDETRYAEPGYTYADWLSFDKYENFGNEHGDWEKWKDHPGAREFRRFLAWCYWLSDARMMAAMAKATGRGEDEARFSAMAAKVLGLIRGGFLEPDGMLLSHMREMTTAKAFALSRGIVEGAAAENTRKSLVSALADDGWKVKTGFLGTSILLDVLTECGEHETAYSMMLNRGYPGWLYSVDQGATTVWERWNSYTRKDGFGSPNMNSFNHYAYGSVLAWMYRTMAGIAPDPAQPGFKRIMMRPRPDRRIGFVKAKYRSAAGSIESEWRYREDGKWVWRFTVPAGASASVELPGEKPAVYAGGTHEIVR